MIDLLPATVVTVDRDGDAFEFAADAGVLARAERQGLTLQQELRHMVRLLGSRFATPPEIYHLVDAAGVPHVLLHKAPGRRVSFEMSVSTADGTPVGTAVAAGGLLSVSPDIRLTDATGRPMGHLTSGGTPTGYDAHGVPVVEVTWVGSGRVVNPPRWRLTFFETPEPELQALLVAAFLGWVLTR